MKVFFLLSFFSIQIWAQSLILDSNLKKSYIELLNQAGVFHKLIETKKNKAFLKKEIKKTQRIITKLYKQLSHVESFHHKIHSYKLLKNIEDQLILMKSSSLNKKTKIKNRKILFKTFFEIATVYDLKKETKNKIFYCFKDKSMWLQESQKATNPINPKYKNCGKQML